MIIQLIIQVVISIFTFVFHWFPQITTLPFGLDDILTSMVSYYHGLTVTIPYLQVVFDCFLYVLGFEIILLTLKLFLGARLPGNHPTN